MKTVDCADQVARDALCWSGVLVVGRGKRHGTTVFINHCHWANRMEEGEKQTTVFTGLSRPVLRMK